MIKIMTMTCIMGNVKKQCQGTKKLSDFIALVGTTGRINLYRKGLYSSTEI